MDQNSPTKIEGYALGPEVSCAGRGWSWHDIGIKMVEVNSQGKLTISDQYICRVLFLLPFFLFNYYFLACIEKRK